MKQKSFRWQQYFLLCIMALLLQPAQAERYRVVDKTAELEKFKDALSIQGIKLGDLLERVETIEAWHIRLDQQQTALKQENEVMLSDRKRLDLKEISSDDLQKKWTLSGRWLRYEREADEFKQDVVRYNLYLKSYNDLAQEMMPLIQERDPEDVKELLAAIQHLLARLGEALSRKDIQSAERLVSQSGLGKEFGYTH